MHITDDAWAILTGYAKVEEPKEQTTIVGKRVSGRDGQEKRVTITVTAYGSRLSDGARYQASAVDSDGRRATGSNVEDSIASAVRGIHWSDLDS
jgi:hypothetical protein